MHVLFVSSWYPDAHDPTLGIFVKRHAEALQPICRISVISFSSGNIEGMKTEEEHGVFHVRIILKKSSGWKDIGSQFVRRNRLFATALDAVEKHSGKIQILQLNIVFPAILWMYLTLIHLKQPLVIAEHWSGYLPHDGRYKGLFMKFFTFSAFRRASLVLCVSKAQQAAMESQGLKSRFDYLPNVADDKIFHPIVPSIRESDTWIHVSNLDPVEKNTELLLKLFSHQLKQGKVRKMIVCGGTNERVASFREMAKKMGVADRLEIMGNMGPHDLNVQMNRASLFLLSSHFEGQPCVILEAMLTGLCVVAPSTGDIPEMLANGRGFIFNRGDFEDGIRVLNKINSSQRFESSISFVKEKYAPAAVGRYLFDQYSKILE
jgi:glycosyltransferase involved in cell wall biosynthesis